MALFRTRPLIQHTLNLTLSQARPLSTGPTRLTNTMAPPWLTPILNDTSPTPTLYAWDPSNLSLPYSPPASTQEPSQRIYVLGIGNLGRMYAAYLARAQSNIPITLVVHRRDLLSQWTQSNGIEITRLGQLYQTKNFAIECWSEEKPTVGPAREVADGHKIQNLLIATKSSAAVPEVDRARRYLDSSSTVVFAQNGMSKFWPPHGSRYLAHRYPDGNGFNVLACIANHGVLSEGPFKSLHASPANCSIGPVLVNNSNSNNNSSNSSPAPSVEYMTNQIVSANLLDAKPFNSTDLWIIQLEKLIVNSCLNPLTALLRVKNGYLFEKAEGTVATVLAHVLREASAVLQALVKHDSCTDILAASAPPNASPDAKQEHVAKLRKELLDRFSEHRLKTLVYTIGDRVKDNTSSMLQDARAGKKTEVRDFNGWFVDTANFVDPSLDTSINQMLVDLVEDGAKEMTVAQFGERFHC